MMYFMDNETCGLHGMAVLLQYAIDDNEPILYEIWKKPIKETLSLIEMMMDNSVVGFNLTFDHFHLNKIYNTFRLFPNPNSRPLDHINELAYLEMKARDGVCLKPRHVLDLMLHARKGPYQSTMDRGDIRIKRVPIQLVQQVANYLESTIKLSDIYFAKKKNKHEAKWKIMNIDGDPDFKDIVLKFHPTNALKALAIDTGIANPNEILLYGDVEVSSDYMPSEKKEQEFGYAPYALAVRKYHSEIKKTDFENDKNWYGSWPERILIHIEHWGTNKLARKYAKDDVYYTRGLYEFFGRPPVDDNDSILSCLVGSVRWKGFKVDLQGIKSLREDAIKKANSAPTAPEAVRRYIYTNLSEAERVVLQEGSDLEETTKKVVLESIAKFTEECDCVERQPLTTEEIKDKLYKSWQQENSDWQEHDYKADIIKGNISTPKKDCPECQGTGIKFHPAAKLARNVLEARLANYEINFYDKLLLAGRLHADFNIIGTLSSRMSGSGGVNTQGVKKSKNVRSKFPLAFDEYVLCGGDFISFEVVLADAQYNDPWLREQLKTIITCPFCEGKGNNENICKECEGTGKHQQTIHGLFGTFVYPGMSYVDILRTKGTADDKYTKSKSGVFTMLYGGTDFSLKERLGIEIEAAEQAYRMFTNKARKIGEERRKISDMFQAMKQPGGIGSRVEWHEPADYIESMFGFRRYFTLENKICKALFELAENPPKEWLKINIKVKRRDREQSASGAVRSALFAAAFNLQGQNTRAAINHVIQSSGATLTKDLECRIWELQPIGIHEWVVIPMNVHDEIMAPTIKNKTEELKNIVINFIENHKNKIPLLGIDWKNGMSSWAEK